MNINLQNLNSGMNAKFNKGMALLDVVLGIVIFVVGMLALASLQGNLTRSSVDGNVRTVGTNIAEELIESLRTVEHIDLPSSGYVCKNTLLEIAAENVYGCIADSTASIARDGVVGAYAVAADVQDFYLMPDKVSVTGNPADLPTEWDTTVSDFKYVELTVSWADVNDTSTGFQGLGSGSVTISAVIPSIPRVGSVQIVAEDEEGSGVFVEYTPGARPDIIPINVGGERFKESETPMPDVIVRDEIVETWFDVVTYNQAQGNVFIRREEFVVVSCDCEFQDGSSGVKTGFLPVTWNGYDYTEHEMVAKPFGISANQQQSQYCDTCCRDHHDDPTPEQGQTGPDYVFDPWRDWTAPSSGAHEHYSRTRQGNWSTAGDGDDYLEVCRMVRKDGFMRVAQDFRQEGFMATQQSFFLDTTNINNYSAYVTSSVDTFLTSGGSLATPFDAGLVLPGDGHYNAVETGGTDLFLPSALGATQDQQVSRGIYVDHITGELQDTIDCVNGIGPSGCVPPPGVVNDLEILPFYEIQTTWLAFWEELPETAAISVTNDPLSDLNTHSRGLLALENESPETTDVSSEIHRGNVGLTATDPIDDLYHAGQTSYLMKVNANSGGGQSINGYEFSGAISSTVGGVKAAQTLMTGIDGVVCNKSAEAFTCVLSENPSSPLITITGYSKNNTVLYICSATAGVSVMNYSVPQRAEISLVGIQEDITDISLVIQDDPCS